MKDYEEILVPKDLKLPLTHPPLWSVPQVPWNSDSREDQEALRLAAWRVPQAPVNPAPDLEDSESGELIRDAQELGVKGLFKAFGKKVAVKGVDFSMKRGEIVGLLGPNGAGKTTIFYMVAGFIKPSSGTVYLNHKNISQHPMYQRAREGIAYLAQESSVFRGLTVYENIWAIIETRTDLNKAQKRKQCDALLEELGVAELRNQKAYSLSGGERRRTEIARALAMDPRFLLLDEPFAGIDPIAVDEIKKIILDLARKDIGILITDHNVRDTLEVTQRAYIIHLGEILVSGSRQELLNNELARRIYLGEKFQL